MPFNNFTFKFNYHSGENESKPISVIANYAKDGKFIPIYFVYTAPDESRHTFKVDAVKYFRDYPDRILFCCLFTNYGWQQEVFLDYHIKEHLWLLYF